MKTRKLAVVEAVAPAPKPVLTPSVAADLKLKRFVEKANYEVSYRQRELDKWQQTFVTNPANAFEWADKALENAAQLEMAKLVLSYVDHLTKPKDEYTTRTSQEVLRVMEKEFHAETLRSAKWPERSTSVCSNQMSLYKNAARAEWAERLMTKDD